MKLSPFAFLFLSALRHVMTFMDGTASVGRYLTMQEGQVTLTLLDQTFVPLNTAV